MIILKSQSELKTMREAGRINAHVLEAVREAIHPGVTTLYLNDIAERVLEKHGATPIFKGYSFGGKLLPTRARSTPALTKNWYTPSPAANASSAKGTW